MEIQDSIFFADPYLYSAVPYLINDDAIIFSGWAYDMQAAEGQTENIAYVLPKEGTFIWLDNLAIPANSPNKYTAELFLNFILRPQIGAQIANEMYVAIPNEDAYPHIEPEILNNPLIFPTEDAMVDAEFFQPVSAEAQVLYDEVWARFIDGVPTKLVTE